MATSGSFVTTGYSDSTYPDHYKFSWERTSYSVEGNYSVIKWSLQGAGGSDSSYWTYVQEKYVTVNGETKSNSTKQKTYNGTTPFTGTSTIYHNSDGTKSFSASAGGAFYYYGSYNSTGSKTWTLDPIPRASTITSAGNVTLGSKCSIKWTPANSSFKYKIKFSLGTWSYTTGFIAPSTTSAYTYTGYTIPSTLASQIPNSTTATMTATLYTYNSSGTQIGSTSAKTFTVTVPSNIVPTVGTISLNPVDINNQNILVQGKNQLTISVSGCTAGTGSSIKSYTFSGPSISTTTTNTSVTTSSTISNTGTLTYTVKVTDTRGRTASKSATIACYACSTPTITLDAYRVASSSSSTEDQDGTYVRCNYNLSFSSVNNTNDATVKIYYKKNSASTWSSVSVLSNSKNTSGSYVLSSIETTSTYTVYAVIEDNYNGSSSSNRETIFSSKRILNIRANGNGIAFGKMADTDNLLDSNWAIRTDKPAETMKNLTYKGSNLLSVSDDTTSNWSDMGNLATVYYNQVGIINGQPSQYGYLLNLTTGPGSSQIHHLWAEQTNGSLFHRGGNTNGVYDWKKLLDSSNYTNYVTKKPTTLYSSTTGTNGTVSLSQSAANFTYLEIYYTDNGSRQSNSTRIYSPNGKYVTLSCIEPSTTNSDLRVYIRTSGWTISGASMTAGRSDLSGANRGVYAQLYPNADGTNVDVKINKYNYIKIFRVIGYK